VSVPDAWATLPGPHPAALTLTLAVALTTACAATWALARARTRAGAHRALTAAACALLAATAAASAPATRPSAITDHLTGPVTELLATHDLTGARPHLHGDHLTTTALDPTGRVVHVTVTRDGTLTLTRAAP
jgi:hypothetical protein